MKDDDGKVLFLIPEGHSITEHKRQEKELQESELRFQAIIDASPVPLVLDDDNGNTIYLNPSFTATFGYNLDDIPNIKEWWAKAYPDTVYREEVIKNFSKTN